MKKSHSIFGEVRIGSKIELYEAFVELMKSTVQEANYPPGIALTGGSSPKAFYEWLVAQPDLLPEVKDGIIFSVSDERCVAQESDESNYGNALRMLFEPCGVEVDNRFPWDTSRIPSDAADWYGTLWELSFGSDRTYDLCMLGMGDDCHTASLFPDSPLLKGDLDEGPYFAAVEVPGKGDRLTITPRGLSRCGKIVVLVTGAGKADALHRVFHGEETRIIDVPITLLKEFSDRVIWLVDNDAGSRLSF